MFTEGMVLGALISLVLVALVATIVYVAKSSKKEEITAEEAVAKLTQHQKEEIIQKFGKAKVPFKFNEDVKGTVTNLYVDYVEAHGVKYRSIEEAIVGCGDLINEELEYEMDVLDLSLASVRTERMSTRRHLVIKELLDEVVYVYEPCRLKMDAPARMANNMASRIAIAMDYEEKDSLKLVIKSIFVSKHDVTEKENRYEFDMLNPEDAESFKLLVRDRVEFKPEVDELKRIEEQIARYNELVGKGRIGRKDNGEVVIYPPSPDEIKAKRAAEKQQVFGSSPTAEATPEPEEAKQEVDEEFVSSTVLNN
jgi:hypothetical protein